MPYDYIEEYQKQDDETIWLFRDKDAQEKIDISLTETEYANPLSLETMQAQLAKSTKIKIDPIQDLHGYDKPWVGGAGKNLYIGSPSFDNYDGDGWEKDTSTYNGHEVYKKALAWNGLYKEIYLDVGTYTFSLYIKGDSAASVNVELVGKGATATVTNGTTLINVSATWERRNVTFNVTIAGTVTCRIQKTTSDSNFIYISEYQLEKNSQATSYEPYSNICPISGHDQIDILGCGKNLLNPSLLELQASGYVWTNNYDSEGTVNVAPNTEYKLTFSKGLGDGRIYMYDGNGNQVGSTISFNSLPATFTTPNNCVALGFRYKVENGTTPVISEFKPMLYLASSSSTYEPYQESNNLSIDLPSTVYGGVLDLESGELVADRGYKDLGDLTWTQINTDTTGKYRFSAIFSPNGKQSDMEHLTSICSNYSLLVAGETYHRLQGYTVPANGNEIIIYDASKDTLSSSDFKTAMSGVQFCYELATPTTIQLTPHQLSLLKAQNNLSTSQYTQIKVTYRNGVFATLEPATETTDGLMSAMDKLKLDNIVPATTTTDGLMSATDKTKLDGVATSATKTESSTTNGNIKINGTETQVYDDSEIKGELSTDTTTIEGNPLNFTTLSAQTAKSTILSVEPIQDLHGYSKPWVGGAGKNLLRMSIDSIKSSNTSGIWNGNVYTINNVTITLLTDLDNNIIGIKVNGTASSSVNFVLSVYDKYLANGDYKLNGCPAGGSTSGTTFYLGFYIQGRSAYNFGSGDTNISIDGTEATGANVYIHAHANYNCQNLIFYPMLRLSTVTDATFEPYTNICPITGRTEIGILGCGKNLLDEIENGGFDSNGLNTSVSIRVRSKNYISVVSGQSYAISALPTISGKLVQVSISYYTKDDYVTPRENFTDWDNTPNKVITIPDGIKFIRLLLRYADNSNVTVDSFKEIQVEKNNQSTQYTAYQSSNNLTINFGQTVYGGTLDVENGVLVVTDKKITLNSLEWVRASSIQKFVSEGDISDAPRPSDSGAKIVSSAYKNIYTGSPVYMTDVTNGCIGFAMKNLTSSRTAIVINDTRFDNATNFLNEVGNETVVYPLATPITIQLTPEQVKLLQGVNNISTTGDKITLTYRNGKVATLGDLLDLEKKLTDEEPYGFIEHMSILDPAQRIEYIGKNKNYKPVTVNLSGDHLANYNDWHDFFVLKENEPYMIKADGTVDYALDSNDYTKKFDGSASDVANTSYTGGAFAWIPKTYKREFTVGDDRYVYISTKKLSDEYEAIGFIDENGLEHDGAWIPMFYGTEITQDGIVKIMTLATGAPTQNRNTDTQKTYLTNANPDTLFFGGPIVKVLTDIMIMLGKNSDVQAVFGTGNMSGGNSAQYMKNNACIDGGAFYGTTTNNVLNKAFHSLVLLTQNQYQRDPYTLNIQGEYVVSPYYKYDLTGDSYVKTGVFVTPPSSNNWVYPHKSVSVPHWGAEPVGPYSGSTTTGWADGQYTLANQLTDTTVCVVRRFAACAAGRDGGVRCVALHDAASRTSWSIGASPLLLSKEKTPV